MSIGPGSGSVCLLGPSVRHSGRSGSLGTLQQISHNLLKRETSLNVGIQGKRLQAGCRQDYLIEILRS